jgi:hypothetical protein
LTGRSALDPLLREIQTDGDLLHDGIYHTYQDNLNHWDAAHLTFECKAAFQQASTPQWRHKGYWEEPGFSLRAFLEDHHIFPNRQTWDCFLQSFSNETHILFPLLHFPSVQTRYLKFLKISRPPSTAATLQDSTQVAEIAQVLLCLALGKHAQGSQPDEAKRTCAAGWNLYQAAKSISGSMLDTTVTNLLPLQNFVLMVRFPHPMSRCASEAYKEIV